MAVQILLLDDDAVQGVTRKAVLERAGYPSIVASHGQEALNLLKAPEGASIRVVITDHLMPGMNGPEFVRSLRERGYTLPVLVLSGYAEAEDEYRTFDVAFRVKPFPPEQLIAFVQYLLKNGERRTA